MWGKPSELKSENGEWSGSGGIQVRNQVISNDEKNCDFEEPYVDRLCVVKVYSYLYFVFGMLKNARWEREKRK